MHIKQYYTLKTDMIGGLNGDYVSPIIAGR